MNNLTELRIRRSKKALVVELLFVHTPILFAIILLGIFAFIFLIKMFLPQTILGFGAILFLILTLIFVVVVTITRTGWQNKEYIITQDRIIVVDGILGNRQRAYNLKGSTSMLLIQPPVNKYFNYGTIQINFLGGEQVNLTSISSPEKQMVLIQEMIDKGKIKG